MGINEIPPKGYSAIKFHDNEKSVKNSTITYEIPIGTTISTKTDRYLVNKDGLYQIIKDGQNCMTKPIKVDNLGLPKFDLVALEKCDIVPDHRIDKKDIEKYLKKGTKCDEIFRNNINEGLIKNNSTYYVPFKNTPYAGVGANSFGIIFYNSNDSVAKEFRIANITK